VHLVGIIIEIYCDARTNERQIYTFDVVDDSVMGCTAVSLGWELLSRRHSGLTAVHPELTHYFNKNIVIFINIYSKLSVIFLKLTTGIHQSLSPRV
jgi:hypothetical protein